MDRMCGIGIKRDSRKDAKARREDLEREEEWERGESKTLLDLAFNFQHLADNQVINNFGRRGIPVELRFSNPPFDFTQKINVA
jgi:hypothetical protein